jgi:spore coat protein CotH
MKLTQLRLWFAFTFAVLLLASVAAQAGEPIANDDDRVFEFRIHEMSITLDANDWEGIRRQTLEGWRRASTVIYDGVRLDEVGVEAKGHVRSEPGASVYYMYPNLHIDFSKYRRTQTLFGLRRFSLKSWCCDDNTLMVEKLALGLYADFGVPAMRTTFAKVTVNGQYIGLYRVIERARPEMIARYFDDNTGNLYQMQNTASRRSPTENLDAFAYNEDNPDDPASYMPFPFAPYRLTGSPDGQDILALIRAVNQATPAAVRLAVSPLLDLNSLIDYLVVDMSMANTDGLVGYSPFPPRTYNQNNVVFYHDPTTNRFFLIPIDIDGAFDAYDRGSLDRDLFDGWDQFLITNWILYDDELINRFYDRAITFRLEVYQPDQLNRHIDMIANLIRQAVREDLGRTTTPPRPLTPARWDQRINELKNYVLRRAANLYCMLGGC